MLESKFGKIRLSIDVEGAWGDLQLSANSRAFREIVKKGSDNFVDAVLKIENSNIKYIVGVTGAYLLRSYEDFYNIVANYKIEDLKIDWSALKKIDSCLLFSDSNFLNEIKNGTIGIHGFTHALAGSMSESQTLRDYSAAIKILENHRVNFDNGVDFIPPQNQLPSIEILKTLNMRSRISPSFLNINFSSRKLLARSFRVINDHIRPLFIENNCFIFPLRLASNRIVFNSQLKNINATLKLSNSIICDCYFHPHDLHSNNGLENLDTLLEYISKRKILTLGNF